MKNTLALVLVMVLASTLYGNKDADFENTVNLSTAKTFEGQARAHEPVVQQHSRGIMIDEGFEGTFPPAGWDTLSAPGGIQGGSTLIPWHQDANYMHNGSYGAAYGWGYNLNGWMRILNLDFSNVASATLSWWWESSFHWSVDPNDNADLFVEVSTDGGTSWDTLWTFGDSADVVNSGPSWPWGQFEWVQSTLNLDAYAGQPNVYVGFHVVADDNADIGLDDVLIDTTEATVSITWDFETGRQNWINTNGQPFPAGWDVEPSDIHSLWTPPEAGDSSMWIDSYAAGSGVWVQDTALSPVLIPDATTEWLKYAVSFRMTYLGTGDWLEVGIKYHNGTSWAVDSLTAYPEDTLCWDSVDVSAYNAYDSIQIYFYYDNDDDWAWYAAFDNVMINALTSIAEKPITQKLNVFGFAPDMPNPMAKGHIAISYTTTVTGKVSLKVYDATGRLIRILVDEVKPVGVSTACWDSKDENYRSVSNGIYFLKLKAEGQNATHKLIFIR